MAEHKHLVTENPPVEPPEVSREEKLQEGTVPVFEADPTRTDLTSEWPDTEVVIESDRVVGPDSEYARINPPEGRGTLPELWSPDALLPEDSLAQDGPLNSETTAVIDGKEVTSSEGEQAEADYREKYGK